MELKRVVVTGLGAVTPLGNSAEETWKNMLEGVSGAGPITHFDASKFKTQFACEVKNFNVSDYIDRKEARKMDLYTQYAIASAKMAIEDCGLNLETANKNRIGVIYGVGIGGIHTFEEEADDCRHCSWTYFYHVWFPWSQLLYDLSVCIINQCSSRRF